MKNIAVLLFAYILLISASCGNDKKMTMVQIDTEFGSMKAVLYNETPLHRDNFVKLINEGFYDDLLFHRVMNNFMIQGGDPNSRDAKPGQMLGSTGPGYTIPAEINPSFAHIKGALAAARKPDGGNPERASSGSQFYVVHGRATNPQMLDRQEKGKRGAPYTAEQRKAYAEFGGYPPLDGDYTVFGQVIEGLEVIDAIAAVQVGQANRPVKDVKMKLSIVKK